MSPHILLIIKQLGDFVKENTETTPLPPNKQTNKNYAKILRNPVKMGQISKNIKSISEEKIVIWIILWPLK